jgi:hypothetical protein
MTISIGFEVETRDMTVVNYDEQTKKIYNEAIFHTFPISDEFYVYPDSIINMSPNSKYRCLLEYPYSMKTKFKPEKVYLKTSDGNWKYHIPGNELELVFKDAEFVVTFSQWKKSDSYLEYILNHLHSTIHKIQKYFEKIGKKKEKILLSRVDNNFTVHKFPYSYICIDQSFGYLSMIDPEQLASDFKFTLQCTFGISFLEAKNLIQQLTPKDRSFIFPMIQCYVDGITSTIESSNVERIKSFLWLYAYSFFTMNDRANDKQVYFIIRHTFQELFLKTLTQPQQNIVKELIKDDENPWLVFLKTLIFHPLQQTRFERQELRYTSCFQYVQEKDAIFIEFRGLNALLKKNLGIRCLPTFDQILSIEQLFM